MRTRICTGCGKEEDTHSKVEMCATCCAVAKKARRVERERAHLTDLGYQVKETLDINHGRYRVVSPCCGGEYSPIYGNIITRLKTASVLPCGSCGPVKRMAHARKAFTAKYSRDPSSTDYADWMDYNLMVRRLTQANYLANKHLLNPDDLPRTVDGWHLDHRVPVSVCFDEGISVQRAASLENLQMVRAQVNLQKSKFVFDPAILENLR